MCSGRGAAAAADDVDQAGAGEFADHRRHGLRRLVIAAEFVGQAGIGMGADQRVGGARQIGDIGAQFLGAQRAVEADGEGIGMAHRMPEGFRRLAGQRAARQIGDGAGNPHRQALAQFVEHFLDGEDRGLGVQRVEHGLDHQDVGAAADQAACRLEIGRAQIVEGDVAEGRIVHVGRDRGGAVGRAQHAGDQARPRRRWHS